MSKVEGDGNIIAGRDVNIRNFTKVVDADNIDEFSKHISLRYGALFSARFDGIVSFSAEKLFSSLSQIDIPPNIIFQILNALDEQLDEIVGQGEGFNTGHVRLAVMRCIQSLPKGLVERALQGEVGASEDLSDNELASRISERRQQWSRRYARRYGNPDQSTKVILHNGQERQLDFHFLYQEIVPEVLRRLLGSENVVIKHKTIFSKTVLREMSRAILENTRGLSLYSIRYKSLLYLAEELALQPPHPWLATVENRESMMDYDRERIEIHLSNIRSLDDYNDESRWHSFNELVSHSCSLILASYCGFVGKRYLGSLQQLRLWKQIRDENVPLWDSCELRELSGDLFALSFNEDEFWQLLMKTSKFIEIRRIDNTARILDLSEEIVDRAQAIAKRRKLIRQMKEVSDVLDYEDDAMFEAIVTSLLSISGVRRVKRMHDKTNKFGVVLKFTNNSAISQISAEKKDVLVVSCAQRDCNDPVKSYTSLRDIWQSMRRCASIILVYSDEDVDLAKNIIKLSEFEGGEFDVLPVGIRKLMSVPSASNTSEYFEEIIDECELDIMA